MTRVALQGCRALLVAGSMVVATTAADSEARAAALVIGTPYEFAIPCRSTDGLATNFRTFVARVATGVDTASISSRNAWNIPFVADSEIVFVTDPATCDSAARAHAIRAQQDTTNPPPVSVLRVGPTRYIVFNGKMMGEFLVHFVFDSLFNFLETI